jgi:hypothetical protein
MTMRNRPLNPLIVAVFLIGGVTIVPVRGEYPVVEFDVGWTVACRDVTPDSIRSKGTVKMIEAVFRLSPQLLKGKETDLKRVRYDVYGPDGQMPVMCFAPGSVVGTNVIDGTVEIESVTGEAGISFAYVIGPKSGKGIAEAEWRQSRLRYKLLAPKTLVQATGTTRRGGGVYYDLRPSTQDTLQRQREFAVVFEVPKTWRADYITFECLADGYDRGVVFTEEGVCGLAMYSVGLYMEGDDEARKAAKALAEAQKRYFEELTKHQKEALMSQRTKTANWAWLGTILGWIGGSSNVGFTAGSSSNFMGAALRLRGSHRRNRTASAYQTCCSKRTCVR